MAYGPWADAPRRTLPSWHAMARPVLLWTLAPVVAPKHRAFQVPCMARAQHGQCCVSLLRQMSVSVRGFCPCQSLLWQWGMLWFPIPQHNPFQIARQIQAILHSLMHLGWLRALVVGGMLWKLPTTCGPMSIEQGFLFPTSMRRGLKSMTAHDSTPWIFSHIGFPPVGCILALLRRILLVQETPPHPLHPNQAWFGAVCVSKGQSIRLKTRRA